MNDERHSIIKRIVALCDYHKSMSHSHREKVGALQQAIENNQWFPLLEDGIITSEEYLLLDPYASNE